MSPIINGVTIPLTAIMAEAEFHADAADPLQAAAEALAMRELLLQRARELNIAGAASGAEEDEDHAIDALLTQEVLIPQPDDAECQRYYAAHPEEFTVGALAEVSHILFAVTPGTPITLLRQRAEAALLELRQTPEKFAALAKELSNCPSAEVGGSLGQIGPDDSVPEFSKAVFGDVASGVLPRLINSRYGFHIVLVARRIPGRVAPFERVLPQIAQRLRTRAQATATRQFLQVLIGRAKVEGLDWQGAATPLVQ